MFVKIFHPEVRVAIQQRKLRNVFRPRGLQLKMPFETFKKKLDSFGEVFMGVCLFTNRLCGLASLCEGIRQVLQYCQSQASRHMRVQDL